MTSKIIKEMNDEELVSLVVSIIQGSTKVAALWDSVNDYPKASDVKQLVAKSDGLLDFMLKVGDRYCPEVKSKRKKAELPKGFVVRKKYLDSDEWNYFARETDTAFTWTPASALTSQKHLGLAIFSTRLDAERMAKRIEKYHESRKEQGKAGGFDVSVVGTNIEPW